MEESYIDISKKDKAEVLAALYNRSKPQGMGFLHHDPSTMTKEEAAELLAGETDFDYLKGRVLKIDLSDNVLRTTLYNRDLGEGRAESIIKELPDY